MSGETTQGSMRERAHFFFLNIGHFLDHLFMLVFATVAALVLAREWGMSYGELIPYATPGFVAFGAFALPAGWLADKWSRDGMMAVFFTGTGIASIVTSFAATPLQLGAGLFAIGVFAAIYHPVGISLVVENRARTGMAIAVNGVWGNLGVASAALLTGAMIDMGNWRSAFVLPGLASIAVGIAYAWMFVRTPRVARKAAASSSGGAVYSPALIARIFAIVLLTTAIGGIVFQSTTFSLPKVLDERLGALDVSATLVGWYAFLVFAIASLVQVVVGFLVDRYPVRFVFAGVAALQAAFFALMPGATGWTALIVATGFMLGAFGQIPINDVLVGRIAKSEWRSTMFACRYIISFAGVAAAIPLIAWVHGAYGFDRLFMLLTAAAMVILAAVLLLPRAIPVRAAAQPQAAE
ncbi:MAG: MFS transporter [Hyphomicrobiales bacterium]